MTSSSRKAQSALIDRLERIAELIATHRASVAMLEREARGTKPSPTGC
jgi:hypothetical protein